MIVNDFKDRKAKAESNKTKMLDLATRLGNMTVEQARQYISLKHEPEESAVKNLIDEYLEGEAVLGRSRYPVYKCNYCERDYYIIYKILNIIVTTTDRITNLLQYQILNTKQEKKRSWKQTENMRKIFR